MPQGITIASCFWQRSISGVCSPQNVFPIECVLYRDLSLPHTHTHVYSLSHTHTHKCRRHIWVSKCCRSRSGSCFWHLSLPHTHACILSRTHTHKCRRHVWANLLGSKPSNSHFTNAVQVIYYTRIHTNAGAMFGYPMLADYQWFWRLDSDSFILGPLDQDPFRRMAQVPTECVLYRICSLQRICSQNTGSLADLRRMAQGKFVYGYMGLGREDEYLTTGAN